MPNFKTLLQAMPAFFSQVSDVRELIIQSITAKRIADHPNPLSRQGAFGFSQTDEDGITLEITRRLDISEGRFCEFGVGDGTENNTLILLAKGWRGTWIGGQDLAIEPPAGGRLTFDKSWITLDNVVDAYRRNLGKEQIDLVSLDFDGNDFHLVEKLLASGVNPKIFIVEYNAKFPPEVEFKIAYDATHIWKNDDYFGASLLSFKDLFASFGYALVCCNAASGANAFFVRDEFRSRFTDIPDDIEAIYASPFYFLPRKIGHPKSHKTLAQIMR